MRFSVCQPSLRKKSETLERDDKDAWEGAKRPERKDKGGKTDEKRDSKEGGTETAAYLYQTIMPLHKSSHKAPRLDPTMISAPLGDFRHTMHIGRGGDAFGDTSFLATVGPSPDPASPGATATNDSVATAAPETVLNHRDDLTKESFERSLSSELQRSGSTSSLTFDMDFNLDMDLGPSIMGDVLGVMDGLGLDAGWTGTSGNEQETRGVVGVEKFKMMAEEESVSSKNEWNGKLVGMEVDKEGGGWMKEGNGELKAKSLKPKVRFSDKREEIIRQASEEEGQVLEVEEEEEEEEAEEEEEECVTPNEGNRERRNITSMPIAGVVKVQHTSQKVDSPPSPASSHSSEYEGVSPLDRRRVDSSHSETDTEEEDGGGDSGRGYTFEDEFDDEIGL
ncbi:hypothetical protein UPYG_G00153760 [Umbra pygmaea]|uniref:CRIB domain-containing protein n=1 Tax=Umbra pygmaea TaxID=75934 RepID=A0ABD0WXM4_UMBPY